MEIKNYVSYNFFLYLPVCNFPDGECESPFCKYLSYIKMSNQFYGLWSRWTIFKTLKFKSYQLSRLEGYRVKLSCIFACFMVATLAGCM